MFFPGDSKISLIPDTLLGSPQSGIFENDGTHLYFTLAGVRRQLDQQSGTGGTVTTLSVVSANGLAGSVANATTTPAITLSTSITGLLKGNGTAISAAVSNTDYLPVASPTYTGTMTGVTLATTGAVTHTAANASNIVPLSITQNDTTNNPVGLTLTTTSTGLPVDFITNHSAIAGQKNLVLGLRSASTTTGTETTLHFSNTTVATATQSSGTGQIGVIRTNTPAAGDAVMVFRTITVSAGGLTERMRLSGFGLSIGLGADASASLHLKAGTASASTAPLKFTSGALLTTAEAGAVEFLTDKYYATITTGAARKEFILGNNAVTEGVNLVLGTTTGSKIGTATSQKIGFWNATPIVQPAGANQAAITDSTTGTASFTLADVTATPTQALINNNFATLNRQLAAIRTALVDAGIIKGAA